MNVLARVMQAAWNEANKPIGYVKGDEFEHFVRKVLFPDGHYELLSKTHDYITNKHDFVASSKEPDFKFKSRRTGEEFYVEAKYRQGFHEGMLEWCKPYQLKRYQEIDGKIPVYIVLGIGGHPEMPDSVCLVPMKHIRFTRLYPSVLRKYSISSHSSLQETELMSLA